MVKRQNKIYFRADGNSKMGLGHIFRSLALAEMLNSDFECYFIMRDPSPEVKESVQKICDDVIFIPLSIKPNEEAGYLTSTILNCDDVLVLDGYHFDLSYQKVIKANGNPLVCIDDIHAFPFVADLLINHAGGIRRDHYTLPFYTQCGFGTDYLMLRPPFLEAARLPIQLRPVKTAFVCMGGADPKNFTLEVLQNYIGRIEGLTGVIVVLGSSYPFLDTLQPFIEKSPLHFRVLKNIDALEMVKAMKASDIGICSASSLCYEFLSVGGRLFISQTADNQSDLYAYLVESELALPLDEIGNAQEHDFDKMVRLQRIAVDGRSPDRFRRAFKRLARKVYMKKTTPGEMQLYFQWANDPETRQQSYSSDPIPLQDHIKWFEQKVHDLNVVMYTAWYNEMPVGQIRFEISEHEALINYSVAREHRGMGYGLDIIKNGIIQLINQRPNISLITGFVKQENIASAKTFKRLNFTETRPERKNSLKYILNLSNEII